MIKTTKPTKAIAKTKPVAKQKQAAVLGIEHTEKGTYVDPKAIPAIQALERGKRKAAKIAEVVKKVDQAVNKIAAKKVTPAQAAAALNKSIATATEAKQAKKSVVKVTKEAELGRRLSRAKSSLAAGVAAAMKTDPTKEAASSTSAEVQAPAVSYMTKPATAPAKKQASVSFNQLNTAAEAKPENVTLKPVNGKVSFDQLLASGANPPAEAFDVTAYLKK